MTQTKKMFPQKIKILVGGTSILLSSYSLLKVNESEINISYFNLCHVTVGYSH